MRLVRLLMRFIAAITVLSVGMHALYAATGDTLKAFPLPTTCPTGLAWDGKYLWMADLKTDSLYAIHPDNGRIANRIAAPTFKPLGLAYDGEFLWCVCGEEERIIQMRIEDGLAVRSFESLVPMPTGLAWDGNHLWVASRTLKEIHQISPQDGTTIHSFGSPASYPEGLTFDGNYLWSADRMSNRIYMIHPQRGEVVLMFDAPAPYTYGLAWDGKNLWNVDFQSDSIYCLVIDDGELFSRKEVKRQRVEFTHEVRNYGPGIMESLDIYIAVPQDYVNQKLLSQPQFFPEPSGFLSDQWGQKVAHYHFKDRSAGAICRAVMTAEAELWNTRYFLFPEKTGTLADIPPDLLENYTIDDEKFSIRDATIQEALVKAVGEEKNPYWIMRKIFNYVISNMVYELSGGWNTAPAVLKRQTGSCSEYTFVFIALCRAAGLPARYAGSIAIRGDDASLDDVFHRWAEVYLPNYGWIPVDPSRGDSESPEGQADAIGHLDNRYIITTFGGGNSQYLSWTYNSDERWTTKGKCKIYTEHIGEWDPIVGIEE